MTQNLSQASVLVVDDTPANLLAIEAVLDDERVNLVKAFSGREALRLVLQEDFAVILLDVAMPEMDGFETAELIRQRSQQTPIIFITAFSGSEMDRLRGYMLGGVDYLIKPFNPAMLRSKVRVFRDLFLARQRLEAEQARLDVLVQERTQALAEELAQRKHAEAEVRQLNVELEQRVVSRTAQLQVANKELETFAYSVSHDLRTPLRNIDGFILALLEDYLDKLDEKGRDYLRRIRTATQHLSVLIDDLLKLSCITRWTLQPETVSLSRMAREIADALRQTQADRDVTFVIAEGVTATGDPGLLHQVLQNLLDNAWKYTSSHPRARIEFGAREQDGRKVYFVKDDGAGFDMAHVDKLFTPFQRLHSSAEFAGTGIGLATVQRIIHRHGGRVWAEGAVEQGATMSFTLERASRRRSEQRSLS